MIIHSEIKISPDSMQQSGWNYYEFNKLFGDFFNNIFLGIVWLITTYFMLKWARQYSHLKKVGIVTVGIVIDYTVDDDYYEPVVEYKDNLGRKYSRKFYSLRNLKESHLYERISIRFDPENPFNAHVADKRGRSYLVLLFVIWLIFSAILGAFVFAELLGIEIRHS